MADPYKQNAWTESQEARGSGHPGFRMNNLTTAERDALSAATSPSPPRAGHVIFNATTGTFQGYTGAAWVDLSGTAANVSFAPGDTGLSATNVQDAIEEVLALIEV